MREEVWVMWMCVGRMSVMIGQRVFSPKEKSQEAEKGQEGGQARSKGDTKTQSQMHGLHTKGPAFEIGNMNPGLIQPYES